MQSFHAWLKSAQEPLQAEKLATLIAQSPTGISLDRLRKLCGLPFETLQDVLKGLVMTGQVVVVKIGGEMRYRVAG